MPLRFRKSIKIAPGVRLNVSKSGLSGTFGPRGASIGVGKRGVRANVGIPGAGLSYSQKLTGGGYVPAAQRRRGRGCLWLLLVGLGLFVLLVALSSPPAHAALDDLPVIDRELAHWPLDAEAAVGEEIEDPLYPEPDPEPKPVATENPRMDA